MLSHKMMPLIVLSGIFSLYIMGATSLRHDYVHYIPIKGFYMEDTISAEHSSHADMQSNCHFVRLKSSRSGKMSLTREYPITAAAVNSGCDSGIISRSSGTAVHDYGDVPPSVANILLASQVGLISLYV
jgi:hypothetical protein